MRRTSHHASPPPDWDRMRDSLRGWARRMLTHGFVLLLLCLVTSLAVGHLILESVSPETAEESSTERARRRGQWLRNLLSNGRAADSDAGQSDPFGAGVGDGTDFVEFTITGGGGRTSGAGPEDAASGTKGAAPGGISVTVRFDPTRRLRMFFHQIDTLSQSETETSLDAFVVDYGHVLIDQQSLAQVESFNRMLSEGTSMLNSVMNVMRSYGPSSRDTLDLVFKLKRAEYEDSLAKYLTLKQMGIAKDYKIYRYQQKIWMVDELRSEFNKSFKFK